MKSKKVFMDGYLADCLACAVNGMVCRYMDKLRGQGVVVQSNKGVSIGYVLTIGRVSMYGVRNHGIVHAEVSLLGSSVGRVPSVCITKNFEDILTFGLNADGALEQVLEEFLYGGYGHIQQINLQGTLKVGTILDSSDGIKLDIVYS